MNAPETVKVAPAIVGTVATWTTVDVLVSVAVGCATLVYISVLLGHKIWQWRNDIHDRKASSFRRRETDV